MWCPPYLPLIQLTRKDFSFEIGPDQLNVTSQLKSAAANSPALRPINYGSDRPVILAVDSCMNGAGYILFQMGADNKRYPSRLGSITFNDRESRYSQAKLELYGLFRSLRQTQLFTIGVKRFVVEMDAKFIKGMLNNPTLHPSDAVNRWIAAILPSDFELVHVPADKHTSAGGLSRRPAAPEDPPPDDPDDLDDWVDYNAGFFIEATSPPSPYDPSPPLLVAYGEPSDHPTADMDEEISATLDSLPIPDPDIEILRSTRALQREQKLKSVRRFLTTLERPPDLSDDAYRQFLRQASDCFLIGSRLFRQSKDGTFQMIPNVAVRYRPIVYAHDHLGHKGVFATIKNLVRFWWPYLNEDVRWYIKTSHQCQLRQTEYFYIPPTVPDVPSLFRKAHIDTFLMPRVGNYCYALHVRWAMTSWPEGRATTADSASVIADFIFQEILCRWGTLAELATGGSSAYLTERYGIRHIRISG